MTRTFDIIVLGLGANGSSTLYHLARTGKKVLGIDRFQPPHTHGSSHGESRIIRQAYYEDPIYVPLLKAAYPLWADIEKASGKKLFQKTGGLMLGIEDTAVIKGSRLSAETHHIPYEYLSSSDLQKRFPAFLPQPDTVGLLENEAGILFPEACITAFLTQAVHNGAHMICNESVLHITPGNDNVELTTSTGKYTAGQLILSAGAWTGQLLPELQLPLSVKRQPLYWFKEGDPSRATRYLPANMPVYIWEYLPGRMFYGFPDLGNGIKIAWHHRGETIQPDELKQFTSSEEIREMQQIAEKYLGMAPIYNTSLVCMYTNTPDEHFIIDRHPVFKNIIIASPCSGHGFKFSSLTGKILSDMATDKKIPFDLSPFSITRPAIYQPIT
ncbi:N-methyl-L-tryptophan oxidase [Flavitalea sp. BT771]|uniref:N-methyl-L-tryptophan oxidase n=1 Tax=Flavitalea sp. BT771 TaxID=3063329 RepID=UPI0026E298BE|nr:N-methyl-L-tryptophan oxidase [Flavitalea sp. BT771]MDO6432067.1 N-methyl-L-tryptophan oxidase [Flavitalea sp. BT771]MDV6220976.1 N-methyl-L-tryptophan oxidase [Flavitalea sp. BT771]